VLDKLRLEKARQWIESLVPVAQQAKREWPGMRVACCLAQASLESAFGSRAIGGWNLWGIKALKWVPDSVEVPTKEWENGQLVRHLLRFAAFPTPLEGFRCYGRLVTNSPAYSNARAASDLDDYINELGKVWATDPMYAKKVRALVRQFELEKYDA